ncbi:hypothetical protein KY46_07450 [Photobacterium halotolerans]|uniref:Uncharacterized protein n=1 Tax=Photobacterium halotolerans TaxID=265726 RepID=A0A0F5VG40_9GAMM|nr:hypothetical protein KY46_07450 [Photobacterium halotolerans]
MPCLWLFVNCSFSKVDEKLLSENKPEIRVFHCHRERFRTNFQVVGAGSAYNRPGQQQRTKRGFLGTLCTHKAYLVRVQRCRDKRRAQVRKISNPSRLALVIWIAIGESMTGRVYFLSSNARQTQGKIGSEFFPGSYILLKL